MMQEQYMMHLEVKGINIFLKDKGSNIVYENMLILNKLQNLLTLITNFPNISTKGVLFLVAQSCPILVTMD